MKTISLALAALCAGALAGCGHNDQAKAEKTIDDGLTKLSNCIDAPTDVFAGQMTPWQKTVVDTLQAKGLATPGTVTATNLFGYKSKQPGYVLTAAAQPLITRPAQVGFPSSMPCLRSGIYQIAKIEAVDVGNTADGQLVASVRASVRFVPEAWIADTRADARYANLWSEIDANEKAQWLYRLRKSGDDLFFTGPGVRLN